MIPEGIIIMLEENVRIFRIHREDATFCVTMNSSPVGLQCISLLLLLLL